MTLLSTALAFIGLWGCNDPDLMPVSYSLEYSIIDGDTIKTRELPQAAIDALSKTLPNNNVITKGVIITSSDPKIPTNKGKAKGLDKLKNPNLGSRPLRYIAIGSSLTAGFRDGGYFNDGIATSFPAILAEALKIPNFKQPKFANSEYNGFGRNQKTDFNPTNGPVQKYARSTNNLAIREINGKAKPSVIQGNFEDFDNLGVPSLDMWGLQWPLEIPAGLMQSQRFSNWGQIVNKRIGPASLSGTVPVSDKVKAVEADFFTVEFLSTFIDSWTGNYSFGSKNSYLPDIPPLFDLLTNLKERNFKGCILNIPDPLQLPGIIQITDKELYYNQLYTINRQLNISKDEFVIGDFVILPTSGNDSLISSNVNIAFKHARQSDIKSIEDIHYIINLNNDYLQEYAKSSNYPIVDIMELYNKVYKKELVSYDGVEVNNVNFFSSDGIYPSPFGNAVITNEILRTINQFYGTEIDLIQTRQFLNL